MKNSNLTTFIRPMSSPKHWYVMMYDYSYAWFISSWGAPNVKISKERQTFWEIHKESINLKDMLLNNDYDTRELAKELLSISYENKLKNENSLSENSF